MSKTIKFPFKMHAEEVVLFKKKQWYLTRIGDSEISTLHACEEAMAWMGNMDEFIQDMYDMCPYCLESLPESLLITRNLIEG